VLTVAGVLAEEERAQILLAFKAYAGTPR